MHKIFIIGNLVRDPELRTTENGTPKCTFDVAVNRRKTDSEGKKLADFYRVTAWRQLGEVCSRYLQKGKQVSVVGDFEPHKFTTKDGVLQISLEISATDVEFMRGQDQPSVPDQPAQSYQQPPTQARMDFVGTPMPDGLSRVDDSDFPF